MTKPERFSDYKPGNVYSAGEPEYVGAMPVRQEIVVGPAYAGPSHGELELAEHGSIALLFFGVDAPDGNVVTSDYVPSQNELVLVRGGGDGGFYLRSLLYNSSTGWFVYVGEDSYRLDVTIDEKRGCWVVRELH